MAPENIPTEDPKKDDEKDKKDKPSMTDKIGSFVYAESVQYP